MRRHCVSLAPPLTKSWIRPWHWLQIACGHCIKVIVTIKEIIEIATQTNNFCFVAVDSTKIALHTYCVMVDSTKDAYASHTHPVIVVVRFAIASRIC